MEEFEEELLQVAGRSKGSKKRSRKRAADSDDEEEEDPHSSEEEEELKLSDSEDERRPRKSRRGRKQAQEEEEADEEEDEEDDGYGSDLYIDEEDRRKLEAMTELDREWILSERAEERDKIRQRKALLKSAKQAEPRGTQRQSSRQKKVTTEKDSAIKRIEAARKRQEKGSKKSRGKGSEDEYSESEEDDEDEDDEEEEEEERGKRASKRRGTRARPASDEEEGERSEEQQLRDDDEEEDLGRGVRRETFRDQDDMDVDVGHEPVEGEEGDEEEAQLEDIKSIQLTRTQLEAMADKPFFDGDGMNGALVRMAYGGMIPDEKTGEMVPQYVMMQITGIVTQGRTYPFGPRAASCNKYLVLVDGIRAQRTMPMTNVSNQAISSAELERWMRHGRRANVSQLTKAQVEEARKRITDAINYRWDSSKVKEMLARKRQEGLQPVNVAAEKARLKRLLLAAQAAGDDKAVEASEYEAALRDLEVRSAINKGDARSAGMAHINTRNRHANFQVSIKNVSNKLATTNASERKGGADPFSRRATRPNIYWNTTKAKGAEGEPTTVKVSEKSAVAMATPAGKLKGSLAHMDPAELVKHLDVTIDLQPLQEFTIAAPLAKKVLGLRWAQSLAHHANLDLSGKTVLTVADWKRRAGY